MSVFCVDVIKWFLNSDRLITDSWAVKPTISAAECLYSEYSFFRFNIFIKDFARWYSMSHSNRVDNWSNLTMVKNMLKKVFRRFRGGSQKQKYLMNTNKTFTPMKKKIRFKSCRANNEDNGLIIRWFIKNYITTKWREKYFVRRQWFDTCNHFRLNQIRQRILSWMHVSPDDLSIIDLRFHMCSLALALFVRPCPPNISRHVCIVSS